ncbi:MAG: serine/threonine protein kinase [Gallionellales bacterium GWA2_60_142]|nr:MAG: serine/threonine protein kinase [Gallionellales bacterium GWA2_60_142]HCI13034.1 serine/threonine protein kinase [Gallionellaceae bacterium]
MADEKKIGRFEILGELGRGGQGTVYLAHDPQLDRKVAIKTLRKFSHQTEQLTREALIVSKLTHPNIIALYDAGEHNGTPYLVYAYIEGKTLAQVLTEDKTLPFARAAEIACDALKGLVYAHEQGVSHLDIKPANIMIAKNGLAMVMDFGLATTSNADEQTATGMIHGTPRYVAPEIISGQVGGPLADVYATGAVLYEMVTGRYAVTGENLFEVLNRAAHEQIVAPSSHNEQMDETLEAIIMNALAKKPEERYPSAASMLQDLEEYLDESRSATTEFLLQRMRSKQDFPAISGVISQINQIVASESESSSKLASVILQDLALTNKLLRLVNTATFSQFGGSINTISKAVVILGFETVRNIATKLILLEFLQNKAQAVQLKEEIVKGVLAGELAAKLAARNGLRDIEEVLICSMFHNLGKMLALYYFYEESQEIANLIRDGENEQAASARILGIPYAELGLSVARSWNYPPRLIAGMRHLTAETIAPPRNEQERLTATVNLAYDLCEASSTSSIQIKPQKLAELTKRYENLGKLTERDLSNVLDTGLNEMSNRSATLGIGISGSPLLTRAREWSGRPLPAPRAKNGKGIEEMTDLGQSVAQRYGTEESLTLSLNPDSILGAGIQEVTNTMMGEFNLTDLLQMVLETIYRGMNFQRALFMLRNNKGGAMLARFGFGPDIEEIIPKFRFPLQFAPDVFHLAIDKGLDISIEDVRSLNISDKIPAWYLDEVNAPSFILLPLMLDGKAIGLIYADMPDAHQLDISHQQLALLRTLRNQAVLAIKQKV